MHTKIENFMTSQERQRGGGVVELFLIVCINVQHSDAIAIVLTVYDAAYLCQC